MGDIVFYLEPDQMKGVKVYLLNPTTIFKMKGVLKLTEASFPTPPLLISLLLLITILQCLHFISNAGIKQPEHSESHQALPNSYRQRHCSSALNSFQFTTSSYKVTAG